MLSLLPKCKCSNYARRPTYHFHHVALGRGHSGPQFVMYPEDGLFV